MAFGSNDFPLGPNGQFPKQRIGNFDNRIAPPNRVEDVYRQHRGSRLPVVEKDFNSSVEKVKRRMKMGIEMRKNQKTDKFRPQHMAEDLVGKKYKKNKPYFKNTQQDDIYRGPLPGEAF